MSSNKQGISSQLQIAIIVISAVVGVGFLVTVFFCVRNYRRRSARMKAAEAYVNHKIHGRSLSETYEPLLTGIPPTASFPPPLARSMSPPIGRDAPFTPPHSGLYGPLKPMILPTPSYSPPSKPHPYACVNARAEPPVGHAKPTPIAPISVHSQSVSNAQTNNFSSQMPTNLASSSSSLPTDLLHRPSFLANPRPAPSLRSQVRRGQSGKSRGGPDMRAALLTRLTSVKSKNFGSQGDDDYEDELDSASSVYSQASAGSTVWGDLEGQKGGYIPAAAIVPTAYTNSNRSKTPTNTVRNPFRKPSSDPEDRELTELEESLAFPVASTSTPLQRNGTWWADVLGYYGFDDPRGSPSTIPSEDNASLGGRRGRRAMPEPELRNASGYHAVPEYTDVPQALLSAKGTLVFSAPRDAQTRPLPALPAAPPLLPTT